MGAIIAVVITAALIGGAAGRWIEGFARRRTYSRRYGSAWVNFQKYQFGLAMKFLGLGLLCLVALIVLIGS